MPCSTSDSGCLGTDTQYWGLERGTESFLLQSGAGLHTLWSVAFFGLSRVCSGLTHDEEGALSKAGIEEERTEGTLSLID